MALRCPFPLAGPGSCRGGEESGVARTDSPPRRAQACTDDALLNGAEECRVWVEGLGRNIQRSREKVCAAAPAVCDLADARGARQLRNLRKLGQKMSSQSRRTRAVTDGEGRRRGSSKEEDLPRRRLIWDEVEEAAEQGAAPARDWADAPGGHRPGAGSVGSQTASEDPVALLGALRGVLYAVGEGPATGTRHTAIDEGIALAQRLVAACDARGESGGTPA